MVVIPASHQVDRLLEQVSQAVPLEAEVLNKMT